MCQNVALSQPILGISTRGVVRRLPRITVEPSTGDEEEVNKLLMLRSIGSKTANGIGLALN